MASTITISGESFVVPSPYKEGMTIGVGEARALNLAFSSALRNVFASRIKASKAKGDFSREQFQNQLNEFAKTYQLGQRTPRGSRKVPSDPIQVEALRVAKEKVQEALAERGLKLNAKQLADLTAQHFKKNEASLIELAAIRLNTVRKAAAADLAGLDMTTN